MNFGSIVVVIIIGYLAYFVLVILYDVFLKKSSKGGAEDDEEVFFVGDVEEVQTVEVAQESQFGGDSTDSTNEKKNQ